MTCLIFKIGQLTDWHSEETLSLFESVALVGQAESMSTEIGNLGYWIADNPRSNLHSITVVLDLTDILTTTTETNPGYFLWWPYRRSIVTDQRPLQQYTNKESIMLPTQQTHTECHFQSERSERGVGVNLGGSTAWSIYILSRPTIPVVGTNPR